MSDDQAVAVPIGVGFDTARYGHHVSFLRPDRQAAAPPFVFRESREGYAQLGEALERLATRHGRVHFHIRIDAAGQYSANLQRFLRALPHEKTISVGEPKRNKDYRSAHFPKRKADAVESLACARFAVVERPAATPETPTPFLQLREVLSALESQSKRTTRLVNQLHNRLSRAFPELAVLMKNVATRSMLRLLQKYPTAERIAAARLSSLENIPHLRRDKAHAIHEAAKRTTASMSGSLVEELVRQLAQEVEESQRREKTLGKLLAQAFDALPPGNHVQVKSIDGVGKLTAAALVATMISIDRFATPDSLVNYYGVFPEENTSGVDKTGKPVPPGTMRMCQKGNDLVRKLLYMAAVSAVRTNPAVRALFARKKAENKRGAVALGHCMRKLLHLVFAVWKTGNPFDRNHYPWDRAGSRTPAGMADVSGGEQQTAENEQEAAGRKGQSPDGRAVTAAPSNVDRSAPVVKQERPAAARSSRREPSRVDFRELRRQVTFKQVLHHLGRWHQLRGDAVQRRGSCPIHDPGREDGRSFSVHLQKNIFRCFHPDCAAAGNVLDFWAAVHHLSLPSAAAHLAHTFHLQTNLNREEEPVTLTVPDHPVQQTKKGVITNDAS